MEHPIKHFHLGKSGANFLYEIWIIFIRCSTLNIKYKCRSFEWNLLIIANSLILKCYGLCFWGRCLDTELKYTRKFLNFNRSLFFIGCCHFLICTRLIVCLSQIRRSIRKCCWTWLTNEKWLSWVIFGLSSNLRITKCNKWK